MNSHIPTPSIENRTFWKQFPVTIGLLLMYWPFVSAHIFLTPSSIRPYFLKECQFLFGGGELASLFISECKAYAIPFYFYMALGLTIAIALDSIELDKLEKGEPEFSLERNLTVMFIFFGLPQIFPLISAYWAYSQQ